jgi:hypothetical protein
MKAIRIICVIGALAGSGRVTAQIDGLWVVKSVLVGAEDKTPVARWFRLDKGKQFSGNGWQRHSVGSYVWNKKTSELSLKTENEPDEGFGAFKVVRKGTAMTWTRKEEGVTVKVELESATDLPQATADRVKGLWDLVAATRSGVNALKQTDPDGKHFLFVRWDRMFVKQLKSDEQVNGYWFMNAHRPELKLFSENNETDPETWTVSFEKDKLVLRGVSQSVQDLVLTYARIANFPD